MAWDEQAATWDDDPVVRAYSRAAFESLTDLDGLDLTGLRVLDFGCGTGLLTAAIAARAEQVVALDLSGPMIEVLEAKALPNVRAIAGALEGRDLGRFDLVTASSVLAFVADYPALVRALADRLTRGGWFVQWDWERNPDDEEPFGLTRGGVRAALDSAGLVDVQVRTGFSIPMGERTMAPIMGVGRKG